jgi:hypothetical protein
MHSVPHLASAAFYAGFEHSGNTCRASKLITGSRIKKPPLTRSFLRASVNYHLRRMIKRGMVKEASPQP